MLVPSFLCFVFNLQAPFHRMMPPTFREDPPTSFNLIQKFPSPEVGHLSNSRLYQIDSHCQYQWPSCSGCWLEVSVLIHELQFCTA